MASGSSGIRLSAGVTKHDQELLGEQWRPLVEVDSGYEGYYVSDRGRVRGKRVEYLKLIPNQGYYKVNLFHTEDRKCYKHAVHQLVMLAFVGPPPKEYTHVHHGDGDAACNWLYNLEYILPVIHGIQTMALSAGITTRKVRRRNKKRMGNRVGSLDTDVNRKLVKALRTQFSIAQIAELMGESGPVVAALVRRMNKDGCFSK